MPRTSYKETGAREVQIPKETLPPPLPYFIFWRLLFKIIKDGRLLEKLNTHSTAG